MCWISDCALYCVSTVIWRMPEFTQFDKHEIDDAEFAAERRRGFRAMLGEPLEPLAATTGHDHRERAAGKAADVTTGSCACWAFGHWILVFSQYRARATVDACFIAHVSRHAPRVLSAQCRLRAEPPHQPAAQAGCFAAGNGYLRARLRGALTLDLDWKNADMQCEGGPRPAGNGLRVSIGGPLRGDGRRMRMVFGIAGVGEGASGEALPTNVTMLFEGEKRLFATQGDDKCTVDALLSSAWRRSAARRAVYRVVARGFCIGPATNRRAN